MIISDAVAIGGRSSLSDKANTDIVRLRAPTVWHSCGTSFRTDAASRGTVIRSRESLSLQQVPLLRDDQHCAKLIPANLVKANVNAQFQSAYQIESAPDEQPFLRALGCVQPVQRAVIAALAVLLRCIGAQAWIAQFLAAQRQVHEEAERRIIRPLPG